MLPRLVGPARRRAWKIGLLVLLAFVPVALAVPSHIHWPEVRRPYLNDREVALARQLAEQELFQPVNRIGPGEKIYFTRIELLPGSSAEATGRIVLVTHYRYQGNLAVLSTVDLDAGHVIKVENVNNLPTPLAAEEWELTLELARANRQVASLFREFGEDLQVEGKLGWPVSVADLTVPRRDVYLLFRVNGAYLNGPPVVVDLVREQVRVNDGASR